jgi:glycosyltransferase involved in cell wall biosynthesis
VGKLKTALRQALRPILPQVRALRVWPERWQAQRLAAQLKPTPNLTVCYLTSAFPRRPALRTEFAHGGAVKLTFLAETFPHAYPAASLLYTVSSIPHPGQADIVRVARQKGLKIVLNQNGVAYPAWHGQGWEIPNLFQRKTYLQADFIVYQSEFCRLGAEKFLGQPTAPGLVIYNPVDLNLYQPRAYPQARQAPVLLLGGNQYEQYRFESALDVLQETIKLLPNTKLIITGKLWGENPQLSLETAKRKIHTLGLSEAIEFTGTYPQKIAPEIFQRADILIHTKYNDPSPNLIPEALAAGLPVVYSASGGVPELVAPEAGIGIPVEASWDQISLPDPQKMAEAVLTVWEKRATYAAAARQSAEERFALADFTAAHREIFAQLLD